jgi:DNA-binding transcriptional ArsR family regulator
LKSNDPRSTVYRALKHDLRREILSLLAGGPISYTDVLRALEVESGLLAYHLRIMDALVEKDGNGRYVLSGLGLEALSLTEKEAHLLQSRSLSPSGRVVRLIFVVLIVLSVLSNAYLVASLQEMGQQRADYARALQDETSLLVEDSLSTIYFIYELVGVDRGSWTDLLLNTVEIRANLDEMDEMTGFSQASEYGETATLLGCYVEEFTRVLKSDDREYFDLTVEKRYLIRELQSKLLSLQESMYSQLS